MAMDRDTAAFRLIARLAAFVLVAFYVFALIVDRAAGVLYGLLIVLGLAVLIYRWKSQRALFFGQIRRYWPLALAMAAPMVAVLANEISRLQFSSRSLDAPSRLALFALVFWSISIIPIRYLRHVQWAFIAGAILSAVKIQQLSHGGELRYVTDFIPITIFIEMALLMGTYGMLSLAWNSRHRTIQIVLRTWRRLLFCMAATCPNRAVHG
ncbi:hypothetical protein AWV79_03060 [Cupriavidus sp. UYMMa02A]|nr:hypothetical protein AWV79_03060 [Cupriavidus sp. UYMMa02A]